MHRGRVLQIFLTASALSIILLVYLGKLLPSTPKTAEALSRYSIALRRPTPTIIVKKATIFSKPTRIPTPTLKPTVTPAPSESTTSIAIYILDQVNAYRKSQGLSSVTSNSETCSFAMIRAKEINTDFSHDGFTNRINNKTLPYPAYHEITENIAMNSNYENVITQWINSSGHAANMRANTPYVCIAKYGNYYAYEGWRP